MRVFSFHQPAIAAAWCGFCICLFRVFPMQADTIAPQTLKGWLTVGPDMAKVLAAAMLSPIQLYLDNDMVKVIQLEYILRFYVSC
jgi:hypothetical protein